MGRNGRKGYREAMLSDEDGSRSYEKHMEQKKKKQTNKQTNKQNKKWMWGKVHAISSC